MALFAIAVGVGEVAVGIALAFRVYRDRDTMSVDLLSRMKG